MVFVVCLNRFYFVRFGFVFGWFIICDALLATPPEEFLEDAPAAGCRGVATTAILHCCLLDQDDKKESASEPAARKKHILCVCFLKLGLNNSSKSCLVYGAVAQNLSEKGMRRAPQVYRQK